MQQVIITMEGGKPTVEVKGVKGPACKALTRDLERDLGETIKSTPTKEAYEQAKQSNQARV